MNTDLEREQRSASSKLFVFLKRLIFDFITDAHLRFYGLNKKINKKILGYWDFNKREETLGDFIIFLEILSALRLEFNLDLNKKNIDLCFIDDPKNLKNIIFSKTYKWKKNIKALSIFNPFIDTIFYFNSYSEFGRFYARNKKRYIRWPREFFREICDIRIVEKIYKKKKILPRLSFPPEIIGKIYDFYESKVYPAKPIILNIRKNTRSPERNSNIAELKNFLKHYEKNKDYNFIIICEKEEIPEDFRKLRNCIFSKDYFTDIEYDAGLICTSYLSIFPSSGMSMFAWITSTPFVHYGNHYGKYYHYNPSIPPPGKKFSFFSKYQKHYHGIETADWLIKEFDNLVSDLKKDGFDNNLRNKSEDKNKYVAEF